MGRILRVGLMVLLVAAAGVGIARGEVKPIRIDGIDWEYEQIDATTCRIKPKDTATIKDKVTIPDMVGSLTVVEIAEKAFKDCSKLTGVEFPNGLTTIGESAFEKCSKLTEVKFPSGLTTIGESAFAYSKLTAVTISGSVTTIQGWAFYGCEELKKVFISSSVREIGGYAFAHCKELTAFEVDEENASYSQDGGVIFTKDRNTLVSYPGGRKGAYEISSSVTGIVAGAFSGCAGLTAVTIPSGVTAIWGWTFSGCTGLTEVTIPSSVTEIGQLAFQNCSELNKVYWFADANCSVASNAFEGIASPATLYVRQGEMEKIRDKQWYKNKFKELAEFYVVTFDAKGGKPTPDAQEVVKDGTATEPTAPTKKGYIFDGWQLDGAKYDFSAKVTQDITLVAVWKKKEESTPDNPETAVESVQLAAVRAVRNPVGEALELEGMERAARVEVYSVVGARVYAEALRGESRVVINAQGWASGLYVVRVAASDGAKTLRVVK